MIPERPISRPVRILAILTALATLVLLTFGALTTSFRAGMADPVWPTEPWFLFVDGEKYNLEEHRGFLLEHNHRRAGFAVGALASLLAIAAWISGPKKLERGYGLIAIVLLLVVYGTFHREMHVASDARATRQVGIAKGEADLPPPEIFPVTSGLLTGVFALAVLGSCGLHLASSQPGKWVRALAGIVLVCVMLQGLLGGYRVYLDQLVGPELSQIHGTFAQVVFAAMCCVPMLAATPSPGRQLPEFDRRRLGTLSLALVAAVFVQLIWGVVVRHTAGAFAQRMHILTAFAVVALGVWLATRALATPAGRRILGFGIWHLLLMFAVQVALGVEAYLGKFVASGAQWDVPPEMRKITELSAAIRTLHVLIGTAILASSVVIALRIWRKVPTGVASASANRFSVEARAENLTLTPSEATR